MVGRRLRVRRRWVVGGALLLSLTLGVIPGVHHPFLSLFLGWGPAPPRVAVPLPIAGVERVLVIAPHPDDETLALGGAIAQYRLDGHQVVVVFLTSGDANQAAKKLFTLNPLRRPEDFRALGYVRQREAVAALRILGVPKNSVLLLGYPDRGLTALAGTHWSRDTPFTSQFTRANYAFYRTSFNDRALYSGEDLVADLAVILRQFSPTVIYFPHPEDGHPDHRAAVGFVLAALLKVEMAEKPELRQYVVHAPWWPAPRRLARYQSLAAPAALGGWTWVSRELSEEQMDLKLRALRAFRSQRITNWGFLASFVRTNEIFATFTPPARPIGLPPLDR